MDYRENLSFIINLIDRKIANLNMKILQNPNLEVKKELEKYLILKKEIYQGNFSRLEEIIESDEKR